ncbi:MAG: hypothetical protein ABIH78_05085 [Candidatus Peregrinibacteria bacterium]
MNTQKISSAEKILHEKFVQYGQNAKEWTRKCVLLLPEIEKHRIWEKKGFLSVYEYAAKLAGMSHDKVNEALRILRKIEDKPELKKIVAEKGILAVRPVAAIVTKETDGFWAEKAKEMSMHTLETYIQEYKKEQKSRLRAKEVRITTEESETITISMDLDPETAQRLQKLKGQEDWNKLMKEFLKLREEKIESSRPEAVKATSRTIPSKIKKHVLQKTNNTCAFPGCTKPCQILHHTQRFALKPVHDPDKIVPLCKNHERLAHLSLIENEELPPKYWKIRKEPDTIHPKYKIDQRVAAYRKGGS